MDLVVVVIRYKIGATSSAKASGGNISFYNNKTIHAFTSSGTFTNTSGSPLTVDTVVVAGGGGGGSQYAAGGGAGGVRSSLFGANCHHWIVCQVLDLLMLLLLVLVVLLEIGVNLQEEK